MGKYTVEVTKPVDAAPAQVYSVFADYVNHHPKILPKPYFDRLEVLEGGTGAGTVIRVTMKIWGTTTVYQFVVAEPNALIGGFHRRPAREVHVRVIAKQ